ncbi:hypothetical protein Tco_0781034 [Tanacetum coccineum]
MDEKSQRFSILVRSIKSVFLLKREANNERRAPQPPPPPPYPLRGGVSPLPPVIRSVNGEISGLLVDIPTSGIKSLVEGSWKSRIDIEGKDEGFAGTARISYWRSYLQPQLWHMITSFGKRISAH